MSFQLIEVSTQKEAVAFYQVPMMLFGKDPNFIAIPWQLQAEVFDEKVNKRLSYMRHKRWILKKNNKVIGRIAAFDHPKPVAEEKSGAFGFFDCAASSEAASMLIEVAENQLVAWGAEFIDGPIQPGENDRFWGLLVEGFGKPSFGTNWNPPYYKQFFEAAGYVPYYEQITNVIQLERGLPERFFKIAAWVKQRGKVQVSHFKSQSKDYYAKSVAHIYNHAWNQFENFQPKTPKEVLGELQRLKGVMKDDLVWFAHIEGEAAAFMLILPDLNQYFEKINGDLNLAGRLKYWICRKWYQPNRLKIVVMGVHQKYQKLGLESVLIDAAYHWVKRYYPAIKEVELAWVGDFNEPMLAIHQAAGAKLLRRHVTFRRSVNDEVVVKKFEIKTD